MKNREMEGSKKNRSPNPVRNWGKSIVCILVVGFCIFFDAFSSNYSSYSSSGITNPAMESECKRVFPEQNVKMVLYNRYPGCYRKPQV